MSTTLLSVTIFIYGGVSVDYLMKGNKALALSFACYALANVGFILANRNI